MFSSILMARPGFHISTTVQSPGKFVGLCAVTAGWRQLDRQTTRWRPPRASIQVHCRDNPIFQNYIKTWKCQLLLTIKTIIILVVNSENSLSWALCLSHTHQLHVWKWVPKTMSSTNVMSLVQISLRRIHLVSSLAVLPTVVTVNVRCVSINGTESWLAVKHS